MGDETSGLGAVNFRRQFNRPPKQRKDRQQHEEDEHGGRHHHDEADPDSSPEQRPRPRLEDEGGHIDITI